MSVQVFMEQVFKCTWNTQMEGGRIVQCGTAREIIANPVSDYVADFVAHMNPLGVLTAQDVMHPAAPNPADVCVPRDTPVRAVMDHLQSGGTVDVTEGETRIGTITAQSVLARLVDPRG
jgi:glycine betaine/proline transport system ATP-binding protein